MGTSAPVIPEMALEAQPSLIQEESSILCHIQFSELTQRGPSQYLKTYHVALLTVLKTRKLK